MQEMPIELMFAITLYYLTRPVALMDVGEQFGVPLTTVARYRLIITHLFRKYLHARLVSLPANDLFGWLEYNANLRIVVADTVDTEMHLELRLQTA